MKYRAIIVWALFLSWNLNAQVSIGFETISLPVDSFLNGSDGNGGFSEGDVFLPNHFTDYGFGCCWEGWSISTKTDSLTPGLANQYSAITGKGNDASNSYAVSYSFDENKLLLSGEAAGKPVSGIYVTNNAYTYYSMLDGDAYSKRFGGVAGNDPDFFLLTIKAYSNGQLKPGSIDFYLADYRFTDNTRDYVIDTWTFVDLSSLGNVDSLTFSLSSSDNSAFGMNTPAYFCIDDVQVAGTRTSLFDAKEALQVSFYPNPTNSAIQLDWDRDRTWIEIYDIMGQLVKRMLVQRGRNTIDVEDLSPGSYILYGRHFDEIFSGKLMVR